MTVKKNIVFFLLAAVFAAFVPQCAFGVENPQSLPPITVSAHVEQAPSPSPTVLPTTPILISPVNNAFINSHYMTFCFKKSTGLESPIQYYQLFINGSVVISQIPASLTSYDSTTFSQTATSDTICVYYKTYLNDNPYTWKIRVYDAATNNADSATWIFNVDTVPPSITITRINENENLNLTTDVPASIPDDLTFKTSSNYPQFCGKTGSSVTLLIFLTGSEDNKVYLLPKTTSGGDGSFCIASDQYVPLGLYKVNIQASDRAGNTAVMKIFSLLITAKGTPPITEIPTLLITRTLELIQGKPTSPEIPQEQLPGEEELEKPQQLLQLPAYPVTITAWDKILLLTGLILLIVYLTLISIGLGLIPCFLPLFLWFLIWIFGRKKSITYCTLRKKGLSFTTIKLFKVTRSKSEIVIEEVSKFITDINGRFNLNLNNGVWKLKAIRPGFTFPSLVVSGMVDAKFQNLYHDEYINVIDADWQMVLPEANIANKIEPYLSLPLDPNKPLYNKYQRIIFCAKLIGVLLGFWAIVLFILIPSWLSLVGFVLLATIAIRTLEIH